MIIKEHRSPKHLLRALTSIQPIFVGIDTKMQEFIVSWPAALALEIATFAPHLLEKETLRVVIAGADQESGFSAVYQLLNRMLGTNINFEIHLIGPQVQHGWQPLLINKKYQDTSISTHNSTQTLGEWIDENGAPDFVALNQPGFDSHAQEWFQDDDGIEQAIEAGAIVCGGSYGYDEYVLDGLFLESYGYKQINEMVNHLAVKAIPNPGQHIPPMVKKSMDRGEMDALRTVWQIANERIEPSSEGVERFHRGASLIEKGLQCLQWLGEIPRFVIQDEGGLNPMTLYPYLVKPNYVFVMGPLVYDFDSLSVYSINDESKTPLIEGIDYAHVKGNLKSFYQVAEFLLTLHEEHLHELLSDAIELLDDKGADMVDDQYNEIMTADDLEDIFSANGLDEAMSDFFEQIGASHLIRGNPEAVSGEQVYDEVSQEVRNELRAEISALSKEEIEDRDKHAIYSAACLAAMKDDVELAKNLHQKGIDFNTRGAGKHSCLDMAATTGGNNFLRYCLENKLVSEVMNSSDDEHSALHYAAINGNREAFDLLVAHGADPKQPNVHGNSAESIMARFD